MPSSESDNSVYDITLCVDDLRAALSSHGITLPSLRVDLPSFAGAYRPPVGLVALGNCNAAMARRLAAALRGSDAAPGRAPLDVELPAVPEALRGLRRTVRRYLGAPCPDAELCVTELVTNVIRHVGDGISIRVRVVRSDGDRIRVEVTDPAGQALPLSRSAAPDDEEGRGLALLEAVALRWGVERGVEAKTVWCELGGAG
ncbi:ATP-binding protein [Streptomyces sp. NPDC004232]|uniref:ATP-binding protein n=1 Tax=Streptomyces sp. NPDC004232 TaxID=3154454 RepID=UPI001DB98AB9|nr:ATP-binding protein [Streptomyces sp. tea 10]